MNIKYAEITIIRNVEQENIFETLNKYFGYENNFNDKDTIIMEFDDGVVCDTRDEYIDKKYNFSVLGHHYCFPIYFEIEGKTRTLFYKKPNLKDGQKQLDFNKIMKKCKNYNTKSREASVYNMIYEDINKKDILSIIRLKSNEDKPRFIIAYDIDIFDRSNLIYLVDCIFKPLKI